MSESAHPDANIIFGAVIDDALGDEVRVTVIAAGFDGGAPRPALLPTPAAAATTAAAPSAPVETVATAAVAAEAQRAVPAASAEPGEDEIVLPTERKPRRTIVFDDAAAAADDDDLDVPDFLK